MLEKPVSYDSGKSAPQPLRTPSAEPGLGRGEKARARLAARAGGSWVGPRPWEDTLGPPGLRWWRRAVRRAAAGESRMTAE